MPLLRKLRVLIFLNCSVITESYGFGWARSDNLDLSQYTYKSEDTPQNRGGGRQEEWVSVGCMRDVISNKTQVFHQNITKRCLEYCENLGFGFAGIQKKQCRCGSPSGIVKDDNECEEPWWNVFASKGKYRVSLDVVSEELKYEKIIWTNCI